MPSFGFDTTRLSLWEWCRLRGQVSQVVELVIVPEPDTIIFAGIGIGMAAWSIWKRRRIAQIMQVK